MSHRALVAVERGDGNWEAFRARDAGADERLERLGWSDGEPPAGLTGGAPVAVAPSLEALLAEHLDPLVHEALVLVEADGGAEPYVVLPSLLATAEGLLEFEPRGVALGLVGPGGQTLSPAYVRGWFHGATDVLGEAVDADLLSPEEAIGWVEGGIRRLAGDQHPLLVVP